ncbi:MAG: hypothetical protein WD267_05885 [Balneolales bacterium]
MNKIFFIALAGFFISVNVNAQVSERQLNNGSIYSYLGIGSPSDISSPFAASMGIQGVAIHDSRLNNLANPAIWSNSYFTNVSGGFSLRAYEATNNMGSQTNALLQPSHFQGVLPIDRERIGVSLSLSPITESRYQTEIMKVIPGNQNNSGEDLSYSVQSVGTGGLNRLELGFGIQLIEGISFGYAPSLIFGVLENSTSYEFDDSDYSNINFSEINSNYGFGNRFGLYLNRRSLLSSNDRASLGITFNLPVNLVSESTVESDINQRRIEIIPSNEYGDQDVRIPMEGAVGLSYQFNQQWLISTDVLYQNWSDYKGRNAEQFIDRMKVGIGTNYNAARRSIPGGFFTRFNYRIGASYDSGNLEINNNNIQTYMITAGLGIPSRRTGSSIDINFDLGMRGTEANELIAERIYGIRVSFNLSELMFLQRRLD